MWATYLCCMIALFVMNACIATQSGEVSNPKYFKIIAIKVQDGREVLFRDFNARFICLAWTDQATGGVYQEGAYGASAGTSASGDENSSLVCSVYQLSSDEGPTFTFTEKDRVRVGRRTTTSGEELRMNLGVFPSTNWVELTKVDHVEVYNGTPLIGVPDFDGEAYYTDIAGVFEASFGGVEFRDGLFFPRDLE